MGKLKNVLDDSISVSASILSLALTIVGFSKLELTIWWHFVVAFLSILVVYVFFYILIETLVGYYKQYLQRASIKSSIIIELSELEDYADRIYEKHKELQQVSEITYKKILVNQISELYHKMTKKIQFIDRFATSGTVKSKFEIPNQDIYQTYKEFCEFIGVKYNLK